MKTLYIVQTGTDLPAHYECIRDRVVLASWKENTPDTAVHVPNTTWTTGRNAAYEHVAAQDLEFDYAIFLDDDVRFVGMSYEEGFREFERFLETVGPAIGLPICWEYNSRKSNFTNLPEHINRQGIQDIGLDYQQVDWFDACFNAYRRDVFQDPRILPYDPQFDARSWYTSQFLLILKANLHYLNQVIQTNRIKIMNGSSIDRTSTDYPRGLDVFGDAYKQFMKERGLSHLEMSRLDLRQKLLARVPRAFRPRHRRILRR